MKNILFAIICLLVAVSCVKDHEHELVCDEVGTGFYDIDGYEIFTEDCYTETYY